MDIASSYGGRGLRGRCRVVRSEGDFPKHGITSAPEHLSPAGAVETRFGERNRALAPGHRQSWQAVIQGDLLIDVPPESQVHRQIVRKEADARPIRLDPVLRLHLVDVAGTAADAGVDPRDILSLTFVGNPIVHYLLLGIGPAEPGGAPFALAVEEAVHLPARDLGIEINPGAVAYALPCIVVVRDPWRQRHVHAERRAPDSTCDAQPARAVASDNSDQTPPSNHRERVDHRQVRESPKVAVRGPEHAHAVVQATKC